MYVCMYVPYVCCTIYIVMLYHIMSACQPCVKEVSKNVSEMCAGVSVMENACVIKLMYY